MLQLPNQACGRSSEGGIVGILAHLSLQRKFPSPTTPSWHQTTATGTSRRGESCWVSTASRYDFMLIQPSIAASPVFKARLSHTANSGHLRKSRQTPRAVVGWGYSLEIKSEIDDDPAILLALQPGEFAIPQVEDRLMGVGADGAREPVREAISGVPEGLRLRPLSPGSGEILGGETHPVAAGCEVQHHVPPSFSTGADQTPQRFAGRGLAEVDGWIAGEAPAVIGPDDLDEVVVGQVEERLRARARRA